jgi:PAS domain-containing protein
MDNTDKQSLSGHAVNSCEKPGISLAESDLVWENSPLGLPETWSVALRACSKTISYLADPAAVFWGEDMVLLHNCEWTNINGTHDQGQKQRGKLSVDVSNALSAALHGGTSKTIESCAFLRNCPATKAKLYTVLISPLFGGTHPDGTCASGSLVQLVPQPSAFGCTKMDGKSGLSLLTRDRGADKERSYLEKECDVSELGQTNNSISFGEHPVFHRFAEMLPPGLAILDRDAKAVFVNQHFYQLMTHCGESREFKSWPQSIHPDDFDRVMQAYQEAFTMQKQLRTEFRAVGAQNPWRLLLLTPLGSDSLQHVSLREYGGFICSVVDITSEKNAEFAEREAATDAHERREQQERFIDMISHEIRNPLSAMLHSCEDIEDAIEDPDNVDIARIEEAIEAIGVCIQVRNDKYSMRARVRLILV